MPVQLKSQGQWLDIVKTDGCYTCHQLGDKATRTLSPNLGKFESSADAWERRIQSGQAGTNMAANIGKLDTQRALRLFGEWTDRIAAGEFPMAQPPRPQGVERNVVVTVWDWATPKAYLHDEISTDRRNPTVNAHGMIYGSTELSTDFVPIVDPVKNAKGQVKVPVSDPKTPNTADDTILAPSPYWGTEAIWNGQANIHNPMFDAQGRVWFTSRIRPADDPAFCKVGSEQPSARLFPLLKSGRQAAMYDPRTGTFALIDLCFSTHHLQFARDANDTLWFSSGGASDVLGWLNTKMFDATGDAQKSQGWTAFVLDTNGNGKRDDYVEPNEPIDPNKDKRIVAGMYGIAPSPVDGSIWGSVLGYPGFIVRVNPGSNPPATALSEIYEPPPGAYSPRGMDIDSKGVVWASLASGHLASFDRTKCKGPLNGPKATGQHCPEGWTLYPYPGPQFKGVTDFRQCRGELLHLGRSVQHVRPRCRRADLHRQRQRCAAGAGRGKIRRAARPLPDGVLRQGHGRPHRRSERRVEGAWSLVDLWYANAVPCRGRKGHDEQGASYSVAPRSACAMTDSRFLCRPRYRCGIIVLAW